MAKKLKSGTVGLRFGAEFPPIYRDHPDVESVTLCERDKDLLALLQYIAEEQKAEKIFENQKVLKLPIVRNGKQATVGYQPDVWKGWS